MAKKMKSVIYSILTEAGEYSINRVVPFWLVTIFTFLMVCVTMYALIKGNNFPHYNDLCVLYLGVVVTCATWMQGNKITNSVWNTPVGTAGKPLTRAVSSIINKESKGDTHE